MSFRPPSFTKVNYGATYPAIDPTLPALSTAGKVVLITGATGGVGRATAQSFAASGPKSLILLGRREDALAETARLVRSKHADLTVETHQVDLCDSANLRRVFADVASKSPSGGVDVVVHCAGVLAPVVPLVDADPATFLDGYKTTVVGTLCLVQALALANKDVPSTLVNLTTAGILFPPFQGMGAYVSSKLAAVKLLQAFASEHPSVRVHHVHPGTLNTAMSAQLKKTTTLPFPEDDMSLPADFLVWVVSPEAQFLTGKIVFSAWDVEELKARKDEILGVKEGYPRNPFAGSLWLSLKGFPGFQAHEQVWPQEQS